MTQELKKTREGKARQLMREGPVAKTLQLAERRHLLPPSLSTHLLMSKVNEAPSPHVQWGGREGGGERGRNGGSGKGVKTDGRQFSW